MFFLFCLYLNLLFYFYDNAHYVSESKLNNAGKWFDHLSRQVLREINSQRELESSSDNETWVIFCITQQ